MAQERFNKEIVSKTQTVNSECTNCPILISQTIATEPGLRNRRIIGVGEEVMISLEGTDILGCGDATWTLEQQVLGDVGSLSSSVGQSIIFTAGVNGGISTITATFPIGSPCSNLCSSLEIVFGVLVPSEVVLERNDDIAVSGIACGTHLHAANSPSIGFYADQYLLPDNVNFYNISTAEGIAPVVVQPTPVNYFKNVIDSGYPLNDHPAGSWVANTSEVVAGKGTKVSQVDIPLLIGPCINSGAIPGIPNPTPYVAADVDGIAYYDIPWSFYRSDLITPSLTGAVSFDTVRQGFRHQGASQTTTCQKRGARASARVLDPTTPCVSSTNACN